MDIELEATVQPRQAAHFAKRNILTINVSTPKNKNNSNLTVMMENSSRKIYRHPSPIA
jgi:hypothetical protein